MKKTLVLITISMVYLNSFCQIERIELPESGDTIESLIPQGWKILSTSRGDLNKDGINDLVFAIQNTNKSNLQPNEGLGIDTLNLNPRILGIYFGNKKGQLTRKLQSDEFIILQDSPTMDEPFDGLEILENGVLKISFHFWFSAGSWSMSNHSYQFRFQNDTFELIGYEASESHRGTGETTDYSINFSTSKMTIFRMTFDENDIKIEEEENKEFTLKKLKSIESLGKPFKWEFNGTYL